MSLVRVARSLVLAFGFLVAPLQAPEAAVISFSASFELVETQGTQGRPGDILTISAQFDAAAATVIGFPGGSAFFYDSQSQPSSLLSLSYSSPLQTSGDLTPTVLEFRWDFAVSDPDEIWGTHNFNDPNVDVGELNHALYFAVTPPGCPTGLYGAGIGAGTDNLVFLGLGFTSGACAAESFQGVSFTLTLVPDTLVPEPAALALFAFGLAVLGLVRRSDLGRT
jgi:hypothetical protein